MFYASEITFIEILTTKQQWLKIDKNSGACWTPSSVLAWPLVSWDVDCLKSSIYFPIIISLQFLLNSPAFFSSSELGYKYFAQCRRKFENKAEFQFCVDIDNQFSCCYTAF